jgi:hypothetical protein
VYGLNPGDLLFPGEDGMAAGSVFRRVWSKAYLPGNMAE